MGCTILTVSLGLIGSMHGAQLHLYTVTYISTSRVMCSLFFNSSYTLNCRFQFLSFRDLYLFHLYRASFMTLVVFSQLVILHQAVSVITSLESQVRGELLTCVIVSVYKQGMMMTMIYIVFFLFVCLFVCFCICYTKKSFVFIVK